jgi:hypothetical protein
MDRQDGWGGFPAESEAWDGPREGPTGLQEGSIDKSEGWNGPRGGREDSVGESKGWDGPQRGEGDSIGKSEACNSV